MLRSRYIRLFVSSTFEDMLVERDILQRKVFPRITALCESLGWQFEDIDLRWGVSQEASRMQKTMQICLNEIKRCQELSPKPNFLILQGDRYGWIPIPEIIPFSEAKSLMNTLGTKERNLFETWYVLDENAYEGGEFLLKSREGVYLDYDKYAKEVEEPLREIFRKFGERNPDAHRRRYYTASATEKEILAGLYESDDAREHVLLYSRHLTDIPSEYTRVYDDSSKSFFDIFKSTNRLKALRKELLSIVENKLEKVLSFSMLHSETYANEFEERIYALLEAQILKEIRTYSGLSEIEAERDKNQAFVKSRTSFFIGRDQFVETISSRISQGVRHPLIVTGESGCGKSSVMAKISDEFSPKMNVIARFIGHTFTGSFGTELLRSIWTEMDLYSPTQLEFSISNFALRLESSALEAPLLIIIDGLDQLQSNPDSIGINQWFWLPAELAENIYVICSVVPDSYKVSWPIWPQFEEFPLGSLSEKDANDFVNRRLAFKCRCMTAAQADAVSRAISASSRQPIYLTLLSHYASRLHSYDAVDASVLENASTLFENFLDELASSDHGYEMVNSVIALIVLSVYGVSQNEMREMLPMDIKFWDNLTSSSHYEIEPKLVPSVLIIRLLNDLEEFIYHQSAFDKVLITFNHKILYGFASDWLDKHGVVFKHFYQLMFLYFDHKWRIGDLHAVYEMPSKAFHMQNIKVFMELDYCAMKIWKGASDSLRDRIALAIHYCGEDFKKSMYDFGKFDAEASAYVKEHDCCSTYQQVREAVLGLAANWAKDSIVRFSFDNTEYIYPSMINTIGPKSYDRMLFTDLPFTINASAIISDDGKLIMWVDQKKLYRFNHEDSYKMCVLPEYQIDDFKVSPDFRLIVAREKKRIIIHDIDITKKRTEVYDLSPYCSEFLDFDIHVNINRDVVIAFHDGKTMFAMWPKSVNDWRLRQFDISGLSAPNINGFLKDGEWIALSYEYIEQENGEKQLYRNVGAYDLATMNYKGGVNHKLSYRRKSISDTLYRHFVSSASGHDILVSSSSSSIAVCDYTESKIKFRNVQVFNSWGRGETYGLHVSADDKSFWAISGDMRLLQYDLKNDRTMLVINMPVEYVMFKASSNNTCLLMSMNDLHAGPWTADKRQYDAILNPRAFKSSLDYFPSLLTTISADARARHIFTSHGSDPQTNVEGAIMFDVMPENQEMVRTEYNDPGTMEHFFAMSAAVTRDGTRWVYAKGHLVEHTEANDVIYYHIPSRKEPVEIRYPNHDVWRFISRIEYTPDNSAILALSGLANLGESSQDGYLFVTGESQVGRLKHLIELPKDKKYYSFTGSSISNNGSYALVWSGNHTVTDFMGLLIDLRTNKIISRLHSSFDMKFFPDSKATMQKVITKLTPARNILGPESYEFAAGIKPALYSEEPDIQFIYKYTNTTFGDISASGRLIAFIDYSVQKGSRVFTSLNNNGIFFEEYVNACRITYDDIHMFVICDTVIYLVHIPTMKLVQKFHMNYPNDMNSRSNAVCFVSHKIDKRLVGDKTEHVHNSRHFQLYDKGLLISDWDHIFRIEPDGYSINEVSFATISRVWNHRTDEYDEPKALCPMCGKRFAPSSQVLDCIERICNVLAPDDSPCLKLKYEVWDDPLLQGYECPYCGNKLRFNPFIG